MGLNYQSTRDASYLVTSSIAVLQGLAPDGGLYVPTELPQINLDFEKIAQQSYQKTALQIMGPFLADFTEEELKDCIQKAYDDKFDNELITPIKKVGGKYYLELFHGPTLAFKDLALSILPYLMVTAAKKNKMEQEIVILTATSGDTGKAAMEGFADVPNTQILVFYPQDGVSPIQKRQMLTQKGANTFVCGIEGNFDDAQTKVKELFSDEELRQKMAAKGKVFSSANSINIGRLVPQIVYYVYAYGQLIKEKQIRPGEEINFSVPTGNFGDILAGYYAKKIGLPIRQLICASNQNKVLTDFFQTGTYDRRREFYVTSSPSMDILVSSNLERLIFYLTQNNAAQTKTFMEKLQKEGNYTITKDMQAALTGFAAGFATEDKTQSAIYHVYQKDEYVMDPHTAVASSVAADFAAETPTVILSTASPYKFPRVVLAAIQPASLKADDFELIDQLSQLSKTSIPANVARLKTAKIRHHTCLPVTEMKDYLTKILEL